MLSKIRDLCKAYFDEYGEKVGINDMSLPRGGLFDLNGDWITPHQTHREGKNADIRSTNMDETEKAYFKAKGEELGLTMVHEDDPPHWHDTLP